MVFEPEFPETVDRVAEDLIEAMARPVTIGDIDHSVTASIGIARPELDCDSIDMLIRRSDIALYAAKKNGRNGFCWFESGMEIELRTRNSLEADIRAAIPNDEFVPYFEQQIDLQTGELAGFEMLARWVSPVRGLIPPDEFIPVAEETGFPANRLEVEITESSLFKNLSLAQSIVGSLKNQGIKIALDDFGTGYSSLAHLRALPFDRIKIDRSFVSTMETNPESAAIVSAIAGLGASLAVPITAEGIEEESLIHALRDLGCSKGQGWHYGMPLSIEQVTTLLAERNLLQPRKSLNLGEREDAVFPVTRTAAGQ
ncbi:MAG: EAL domain-containing protein [Sphingomonadales bacterium]|nr:EAL domain-containing protein [Sphingomonadales bacterium]